MIAFLGHKEISCHLELLTKHEAPVVLIFSRKRFIALQKLVYLYQVHFLKEEWISTVK
jgi:hypothetical protein